MAYCNITTDLSDQYPDIGRYKEHRLLENWYLSSGQTNTYEMRNVGQVNQVFDDGEQLAVKTSIATVEATAGTFWYDANVDTVYVHAKGSDNLTTATITIEAGEDWDTLLTRINNRMYNFMNNIISRKYPTPVPPRVRRLENTDDYDYILIKCNALLTCAELIFRRATDDPMGVKLYNRVWNTSELDVGEEKGLLNQLIDGDIILTDWTTSKEAGAANYWADSGNTTDTPLWVYGTYTGSNYEQWRLEFENTAATGTATFKLSRDGGTNWDLTAQKTFDTDNDDRRISLLNGLSVVFDPDTSNDYTTGDYWTIEVFPYTDETVGSLIGNARMKR
jgi:hypothetical protein